MAKIRIYDPPPGWPPPPEGWQSPPGWQPDPAWGPPPEDWQLWREERANPYAFALALGTGLVLMLVFAIIDRLIAGAELAGVVYGLLLSRCLAIVVVTGIAAWVSTSWWPLWRYPLVGLGVSFVVGLLTAVGDQESTG